MELEYELESSV